MFSLTVFVYKEKCLNENIPRNKMVKSIFFLAFYQKRKYFILEKIEIS